MKILERKLTEIGEFFARDILSFAILIFLSAFLLNHLASAAPMRSASSITQKFRTKKYVDDRPTNYLSSGLKFHDLDQTSKSWQLNLGLNAAQKKQSALGVNTETSIKFNEDSSFKGLLNYTQYSKNELQNDVSDLLMNFYFMKSKLSNMTLSPYLTSTVPLSKDSIQRQFLNFGVGLGAKLSSQSRLASGILSTSGSVSVQKYFHKYEVAINNFSNTSYVSNQQVSTGWEYKQFGMALQLRHINSWNYAGAAKDSFFHMQTLSWNISKQFSVSAGQTSYGTVISPDQEEVEVRLIDDNSSAYFVSTNYIF
ncbi:MAG: hypothetical protein B7Y39_02735 [Bdellovibrio sp. 28-41-41]|nr:MAG: hypothetical protein B7Y39_02735 [Bdellovibrio sp. 28-41-41]